MPYCPAFLFILKTKYDEKKRNAKAQKPSEMGLHSRVRYVIQPQGNNRTEQMRDIIDRAVYFIEFYHKTSNKKFYLCNTDINRHDETDTPPHITTVLPDTPLHRMPG